MCLDVVVIPLGLDECGGYQMCLDVAVIPMGLDYYGG